tara:strand:- start:369 stop:554 length:186 start_codon:yes stop_codon:yes gene_type:complete
MINTHNKSQDDIESKIEIDDLVAKYFKGGGTVTKFDTGDFTEPEDVVYKFKKQRGPKAKKT